VNLTTNQTVTMTSMELVEFINASRADGSATLSHADLLKKVIQVIGIDAGKFSSIYADSYGRSQPCYRLPKREACLMAMSYSYDLQAKVFDRMTALENNSPKFDASTLTRIDILKLAMESEEGRIKAEGERDHAIATKAQIGSRREATAMANVAKANKEVARLKDQLGFSVRQATILQVEDATGQDFDFLPLRRWCQANEVVAESVPDKRYPKGVKAWPAAAWLACYGVDLSTTPA